MNVKKILGRCTLLLMALSIVAAGPMKNDMVELQGFLYGRTEAKFRPSDDNKTVLLKPGTKALVQEVKRFETGNYGVCLKVITADESKAKDCFWVYHVPARPTVKFYDMSMPAAAKARLLDEWKASSKDENVVDLKKSKAVVESKAKDQVKESKKPEVGQASVVVKKTPSIQRPISPTPAADPEPKAPTKAPAPAPAASAPVTKSAEEEMNKKVIEKVEKLKDVNPAMSKKEESSAPCEFCVSKGVTKDEVCNEKNNYLEKEISTLNRDPQTIVAQLLGRNSSSKYIKDSCFESAMQSFGGPYKTCVGENFRSVPRACLTTDLRKLTQTSFDLTMDCLGDFLTGDTKTVPSAAQSYFFLLAQESGHNLNAVSHSGAGGSAQLTDPSDDSGNSSGAISYVNRVEKKLMLEHLNKKRNASCEPIQQALNKGMGEGFKNSCDRISLKKGNPLLNLVYGLAYQKYLRENIRSFLTENALAAGIFEKIQPDAKEYLESQLGIWSHNTGVGGLRAALRGLLHDYAKSRPNKPIVTIDDAKATLVDLKRFVRSTTTRKNVAEPTNFWTRIQTRKELLEKNAGGGSCAVETK